jgi:hypothetical protein
MRTSNILAVIALATACLLGPAPAGAGKPSGGGSGIKVEDLIKPAGSVDAYAGDISDSGIVAVGAAYWDATWDYRNNYYAVRWTRASTSDPWVTEDLRTMFPLNIDTRPYLVNDAGTMVVLSYNTGHRYVMTSSGAVIDIGTYSVNDLSNNDTMVGYGWGTQSDVPLFWASPSSPPEELPPLASGQNAGASLFLGPDVIGWADDGDERWVVRWVNNAGSWSVHRIALLPPGVSGPNGMNSAGRISVGVYDPSSARYGWDNRPAVWDFPYSEPPVNLPTVSGTAGATGAVLEDGTVVGVVTASSKTVKNWLPVIWPTPTSLVRLPLLSGAKYGTTSRVNAYRQIAGTASFVDGWATTDHAAIWTLP